MRLQRIYHWMLVVYWGTITLSPSVFGQGPEDTLQLASKLPAMLNSCELTFRSGPGPGETHLKVDGDKFYIRLNSNINETTGFDGASHWHRRDGVKSLATRSKSNFRPVKQFTSHPLTAPYTWFFSSAQDAVWADLKSKERWSEILPRMKFLETLQIQGYDCSRFEIQYGDDNLYRVSFARALNGFPIRHDRSSKGLNVSVEVRQWKQEPSGAVIPIEIEVTRNDELASKLVVDLNSLKVNQPVDPNVFVLDVSTVEHVKDLDATPAGK